MKRKATASKSRHARRGGMRRTNDERALLEAGKKLALAGVYPAAVLLNKGKKRKNTGRKNPSDAAVEAFRDFHGRDPEEVIEFESTQRFFPAETSAIGDLVELNIRIPAGRVEGSRIVTLKNFGEAWLTRHPKRKQLYVEGGDQSLDLEEFGLDSSDPHEVEYLGELTRCMYFTTKDHLGRDGGTANYHHRFGKNELTLDKTELIKVGYHVPDEQLIFMGGGYEIPSEGIDG